MYTHPEIVEAAVFSLPDRRLGEVVGAAVMTRPGIELDTEQVQIFLGDRLAAFKIPEHIWYQAEPLPRIAAGKISKKQLRGEMIERLEL